MKSFVNLISDILGFCLSEPSLPLLPISLSLSLYLSLLPKLGFLARHASVVPHIEKQRMVKEYEIALSLSTVNQAVCVRKFNTNYSRQVSEESEPVKIRSKDGRLLTIQGPRQVACTTQILSSLPNQIPFFPFSLKGVTQRERERERG